MPLHHEQALIPHQLTNSATVGTLAIADRCVSKTHVKGERETAITYLGCAEVLW